MEALVPEFLDALTTEIWQASKNNIYPKVHTIFIGGGTPSLLSISQIAQVIDTLQAAFDIDAAAEVTLEANPNDLVSSTMLRAIYGLGINRLSIGMQSSNSDELALFDRRHDTEMTINAVHCAREAGFHNLNLDLIYGFPHQTMESWQTSLKQALAMEPEHLSLYALGLEDGTPLYHRVENKLLLMPDDDLIADMYELATSMLNDNGYDQYEISNWAKPGYNCRHNIQYWRNLPYLGFGPGAHGYANNMRYETVRSPIKYISVMQHRNEQRVFPLTSAVAQWYRLRREDEISETMITTLRLLNEGLNRPNFVDRFGTDVLDLYGDVLHKHETYGLIHISEEAVYLTQKGRLLSNYVFRDVI